MAEKEEMARIEANPKAGDVPGAPGRLFFVNPVAPRAATVVVKGEGKYEGKEFGFPEKKDLWESWDPNAPRSEANPKAGDVPGAPGRIFFINPVAAAPRAATVVVKGEGKYEGKEFGFPEKKDLWESWDPNAPRSETNFNPFERNTD